jgi:hypothetical protein
MRRIIVGAQVSMDGVGSHELAAVRSVIAGGGRAEIVP